MTNPNSEQAGFTESQLVAIGAMRESLLHWWNKAERQEHEIVRQRDALEELMNVAITTLEPFAQLYDSTMDAKDNDVPVYACDNVTITVGDIRSARELVAMLEQASASMEQSDD